MLLPNTDLFITRPSNLEEIPACGNISQDLIRPALRSIRNFRACRDSKPAPYNLNRKFLQTGQRLAVPNQRSTLLIEVYNLLIPSDWKINKRSKGETSPVK
ncbi:hypothetical protein CEXT_558261 [Caerostris extrusa]|uniref:Uncharacterized protein n=1 Tax=Caerostris extrusa TaxID=172846 RepID=A0AAV4WDB5_CAEEX|nr:hypothetical protein CEXT_558261 [Caerostris extrusa]